MGELRKVVDRTGFLRVLVLDARDGQLLVEPDDNKLQIQIWVDANLVQFEGLQSATPMQVDPANLDAPQPEELPPLVLRLNVKTPEKKS